MEYRSLGRTGVMVSPLCLGAMNFGGPTDKPESSAIIGRALEAGITFIDTANVYNTGESERVVGEALKESGRRRQVILATKVHGKMGEGANDQGGSRYHIVRACEESLRRLQTDYIDLYQLHRPPLNIPPDETLRAFDDLVRSGRVLYIGCSTHPAWMVMESLAVSERYGLARYISEQPPYNLLDRRIENELIPLCMKYGHAVLPWSPLAGGILAVWIPAARPDVIREDNVHRLRTKLVVEGANIPLTYSAEESLHKRGVLCAPDFIANAGGVICGALEYQGASQTEAFQIIEEKLRYNTRLVLEESASKKILPRQAALQLAVADQERP